MFHRRESALYRSGLREQTAGFDGIRGISRLCGKSPSCERKFRGATGKRAFHEIEAGKNHAADESSVAPQDIHRGCSARGDHEARAAENRPGSDQRGPAVRPELVRPPIAVRDSALVPLRLYPGGDHGSSGEQGLQPFAHRPPRDVRDDDLVGGQESPPAPLEAAKLRDRYRAGFAPAPVLVQPPFQPRIAAVDGEDHPGLSESSPLWKRSIPPTEASMSAPSSATPTTLPSATCRPACDKATRLPFQAWRCSHSSRNGPKPSRENRARTPAMDSSVATSTVVRDGTASLWLAMSVAGSPIRLRAWAPRHTLIPTPTITALGPWMSPELSINIPPSLRPSQYRSFGHLTATPCVPRRSSAFAAPTATARLKPPSAPAPRGKRHSMEKARLPPTTETQECPRRPRPALWCSQASTVPCGAPAAARWARTVLVDGHSSSTSTRSSGETFFNPAASPSSSNRSRASASR